MKSNKSFHLYALFCKMRSKAVLICLLLFLMQTAFAQSDVAPDFMRSVGKIYVVAAVTLVILITLFVYLIILDRKISRLENRQKNE